MKPSPKLKMTAGLLFLCLAYQLVFPNVAMALTSGPSQPEVQSFEPVGTTDMVDLFTGDFVYNIPLLDVEGYPVNISYHSGGGVEQEASWVGLGWNINPGVINRAVRGLPDDFKAENIERKLNIKPEKNLKVSMGGGMEMFGWEALNLNAGMYATFNNYRGIGLGFQTGASVSVFGFASAGVNFGLSTQNGMDIDYNAGFGFNTSSSVSRDFSAGVGVNGSGGFNSITGAKDINLNFSVNFKKDFGNKRIGGVGGGMSTSTTIPIGLQNYVPVITNASTLEGWAASVSVGIEFYGLYTYGNLGVERSKLTYDQNGTKSGYGYMYLENAGLDDIVDFTRDKDGMFNKTMSYLPPAATTYDVYSSSGQGSGGIFRPIRNDNGTVYDPSMMTTNTNFGIGMEMGFGGIMEFGLNLSLYVTLMKSGHMPGAHRPFTSKQRGSRYENVFFKQAGELAESPKDFFQNIGNTSPMYVTESSFGNIPSKRTSSVQKRDPRGNVFYHLTADEASNAGFGFSTTQLENYTDADGLKNGPSVTKSYINRKGSATRRGHQFSEFIQVNKDGSRYVYGLPAMNNLQNEVSFSVEGGSSTTGTTSVGGNDQINNNKGLENYYSRTVTPSYAHSFLLTNVLSTDYVDITGDGPSDDDLGTYVKFNYSLKEPDYRWRSPYGSDVAQYSPGFYCKPKDDKASYIIGSKEQWYMHSMETKNFVAEYYTSKRKDGKGATGAVVPGGSMYASGYSSTTAAASSYKLDSIKLYNKHDRYINQDNAVPIKTVYFEYNYSLCRGTLNSEAALGLDGSVSGGKLTLKKIFIKYGNSDKNLLSPYQFEYSSSNPPYGIASKDRWGCYKPNSSSAPNSEYPYVNQNADNDEYASAWQMTKIKLPSGGNLTIDYESDDYAYVQNKRATEMFKIEGFGPLSLYMPTQMLYYKKWAQYNFLYFKRRVGAEIGSYVPGSVIYYNVSADLLGGGRPTDMVRGYAEVASSGICPNDSDYGYIELKKKKIKDGLYVNPITHTGINMARHYLPDELHNGFDPSDGQLLNLVRAFVRSAKRFLNIFKGPIEYYSDRGTCKMVDLGKSFVRLNSPSMKKKGGGSRVKKIVINDSWNSMAGGDNATGDYGNEYDYTKNVDGLGNISSGVASYEPLIGGDENPFRLPANYIAQNANKFPPLDPIELFQEEPVGESFYPSPVVGYSKVTVKNIHRDKGRSAQTEDEYEFYTAKDYPLRVEYTPINRTVHTKKGFLESYMRYKACQGYSIIMNDMHGKLKDVKNYLLKNNNERELKNRQTYTYSLGGSPSGNASVIKYNSNVNAFVDSTVLLGQDIDIAFDSRSKQQVSVSLQVQSNYNAFIIPIIPFWIGIPSVFLPMSTQENTFSSLVTTKIVQQYGILRSVKTTKENATYIADNLKFNNETGDVLLTKGNNDFGDPKYDLNYPAYWSQRGMGPTYKNILFEDEIRFKGPSAVAGNFYNTFAFTTDNPDMYQVGDEVIVTSDNFPGGFNKKLWVTSDNMMSARYGDIISPTVFNQIGGNIYSYVFHAKIIRSGFRNMLTAPMQTSTSLDAPAFGSNNMFKTTKTINTSVTTYSDALVHLLPWHSNINNDTNKIINGYRGNYRVAKKVAYMANRDYSMNHTRVNGTFNITIPYWQMTTSPGATSNNVSENPAALSGGVTAPWKVAQNITAYNIWGNEIENRDALNVPSSALFGFNHLLPTAVGVNTKNYELFAESFEDYHILHKQNWYFNFSPFKSLFNWATVPAPLNPYKYYDITTGNVQLSNSTSHTGNYSLRIGGTAAAIYLGNTSPQDQHLNSLSFDKYKKYVVSCWVKVGTSTFPQFKVTQVNTSNVVIGAAVSMVAKSNIIDGWQLYEATISITGSTDRVRLDMPANFHYDDIRSFPVDGNMKSFVYNPINQKLVATLDENNFATFYEYDSEGQLIRINKETERGIMTVQESRSANAKQ